MMLTINVRIAAAMDSFSYVVMGITSRRGEPTRQLLSLF